MAARRGGPFCFIFIPIRGAIHFLGSALLCTLPTESDERRALTASSASPPSLVALAFAACRPFVSINHAHRRIIALCIARGKEEEMKFTASAITVATALVASASGEFYYVGYLPI